MDALIYYFSGTGNSLAISKSISAGLENCPVRSIPGSMKKGDYKVESDVVGFVFPNHYGKVPGIVTDFISKAVFEKVRYVFAVISGGGGSGYAFNGLKKSLRKKNLFLNAAMETSMPGNYIIAPYYDFANRDEEGKRLLFEETGRKIESLTGIIKERKNHFGVKYGGSKIISLLLNLPNNLSDVRKWDKYFSADEKCNSCSTCQKICPVGNIKMAGAKPSWNHDCRMCMACIQFCPAGAVQFKDGTRKRKRYHHPSVSVGEMLKIL
jgi:ferredoxin